MRKTIAFALLFLVVSLVLSIFIRLSISSFGPPEMEWDRTYGREGDEHAVSIVQTNDEGYAIAGTTWSIGAGDRDAWLVKANSTGHMEWNQTYGGVAEDEAYSVVQTEDGGYALGGYTRSFGAGDHDFWLVKVNSTGHMQWNQTYGGANAEQAVSMIQTDDKGYAMAGYTQSLGLGYYDSWLVKTDEKGDMEWNQTYGGAAYESALSVVQASDGGYAMAGWTNSYGAGGNDFWLVKTDKDGNQVWSSTYGGTSKDIANSMVQTSDGGYVLAGDTFSFGAGSNDFWLVKVNSTGHMEWNQTYGGATLEIAYSVVQTEDGGYALGGYTRSFGAGDHDFWLVKVNSTGHVQWNQTYGGPRKDNLHSLVQTYDEGYAMAGYTWSFGAGSSDFWLIKLAPETPPITWEYTFEDPCRGTMLKISTDDKHFQFTTPDKEYPAKYDPDMRIYEGRYLTSITICYEDDEIKLSATAVNGRLDFCIAYAKDQNTGKRYLLIDGWASQGTCFFTR